jgi:PAS domain S-box-containing protein
MHPASPLSVQTDPAKVATLTGWVLVGLSLIAFAGWAFHLPLLATIVPGAVPIKANTAAAFMLAALALLRRDHRDLGFYAICVVALGALTEIQNLTNADFGIDQLLVRDDSHFGLFAGRMSPVTSTGFVLLGSALFLMNSKRPALRQVARGLALLAGGLGAVALMGHMYDTHAPLNQVRPHSNVAIPTALAFMVGALGVLYANPCEGIARQIHANNAGGLMLRHLLPAGILFPFVLGYAVRTVQLNYEWEDGFSMAVGAAAVVACLVAVMLANASELEREDLGRRESEQRFRHVANTAPVMIWESGTDKLCNYFNEPWLLFTGGSIEAQLGNGWADGVHPDDLPRCLRTYTDSFDRREPFRMQYRLRRYDGEYRWILDTGVPRFTEGKRFTGYIGSCIDVTDRKVAEETLADLEHRLINAQEEERSRIARELHDDINQRLAILGWELQSWDQSIPEPEPGTFLASAIDRLSKIGADIQVISRRLHSSHLEYLGLETAAEVLCNDLRKQQQVEIDFTRDGVPRTLSKDISLSLYRVMQEALQNAIKHSGAQRLTVELIGDPGGIRLAVSDDGVGFDPQSIDKRHGLGLISMRERMRMVRGEFSVRSEPGHGATVTCRVPLVNETVVSDVMQEQEKV